MPRSLDSTDSGYSADKHPQNVKDGAARLLVYAPPFVAWLLTGVAGVVAWRLWGRDYTARPWLSMGAALATVGLALWIWRLTRARSDALQVVAVGSGVLGGVWLILAGILGPFTRPLPDLWLGVGGCICLFWVVRRATLSGKNEQTVASTQADKLVKILDGARVGKPKVIEGETGAPIIEVGVTVDRGRQTLKDLQDLVEHAETLLKMRPGAIAIGRDHDAKDAGKAVARFVPIDPLATSTMWPGPSNPGASVHEPFPVGPYEDGSTAKLWLTGDEATGRALAMWLLMGVTGAGKSQGAVTLMADAMTRREVVIFGVDTRKGLQTFAPLLEGLNRVALDEATARAMVEAIKRAIPARSKFLGRRGYKQWEPGCGLKLLVLWVEEARWLANSSGLKALVSEARSVGIAIVVSLQRASHTNMDTDTRAQLTGNWCFGVEDDIDATFALPAEVLDAGARPDRWSNREPGKSYLVAPGIAERYWAMPLRSYWAKDPQIAAAVREWAHMREALDETTMQAFGPAYQSWPTGVDLAAQMAAGEIEDAEVVGDDADWPGPAGVDVEAFDEEDEDDGQSDDDGLPPLGPPIEPEFPVDPDAPIGPPPPGTEGFEFGAASALPKLTTAQARAVVDRHLRRLLEGGQQFVTPAEIDQMKPPTTRTREWVRQELNRRCEAAESGEVALAKDLDADKPGIFVIQDPALITVGR